MLSQTGINEKDLELPDMIYCFAHLPINNSINKNIGKYSDISYV